MKNLNVALLHEHMVDKNSDSITASVTLIDIHDISRSCKTFGCANFFIAHPSEEMQNLLNTMKSHWDEGYGSTYNPNRKEALQYTHIVQSLDDILVCLEGKYGKKPILVASSAKEGRDRMPFKEFSNLLQNDSDTPFVLMLGTGWGMSEYLLDKATYFLEPIKGFSKYNHLSVRSACAIMLDRILQSFR